MVYINLFNGRTDKSSTIIPELRGPVIGPFISVVCTYLCTFKAMYVYYTETETLFIETIDDLIYFDGVYYADMEIIGAELIGDFKDRKLILPCDVKDKQLNYKEK